MDLSNEGNDQVVKDLQTLALGPLKGVQCFSGIVGNGFRFHTRDIEMKRVHQNSGVMVKGIVGDTEKNYYGILTDILVIQYLDGKWVMLFRCDWWDVHRIGRGVKVDKHGYVSVNSLCSLRTKEPFVLMSQAKQVFYVSDGLDPNWLVVVETHPRHHYNVAEREVIEDDEDALQQLQPRVAENALISQTNLQETHDPFVEIRDDIGEMVIDATEANQPKDFDENVVIQLNDNNLIDEDDSESDQESDDDDIDLA
ncbi:Methionine--tRNA ligase [Bienertia sinuspersici]